MGTKNAADVVKSIEGFLLELEQSLTKPNIILMSREQYNIVLKEFPYLVAGKIYKHRMLEIPIVFVESEETIVGAGLVYGVEDFNCMDICSV